MSRLPLRLRVAAGFAVAMALVLAGTGLFLYARLGDDLAAALDQQLQLRAQDLSQVAGDPRDSLAAEPGVRLIERGESFAQLLDGEGRVLDATAALGSRPLLDAAQRRTALRAPFYADLPRLPDLDEGVRLLATRVQRGGRRLILVVGATAENRRETLASLREELLIAGPVALLLATALGWLLAGTGLRTVEAMRSRAARISADRPAERLPVPPSGDELQRLGMTLNEMLARLQDGLERERGFVADAGHELRTPLALMRAELDYALRYADSEDELRVALQAASAETDRLVSLAEALLLIASSERGRPALHLEPVAAAELLESVRRRFAWRAEQLGRGLEVEGDPGLVLPCDRLRLEQALGNLVDNALRHGADTVRMAARVAGADVVLSVADRGPGFDPDILAHVFERFSHGRERTDRAGAGLGLAIVESIARAHGGRAVAGNARTGAEVTLRLPATAATAVAVAAASGPRTP